MGSYPYGYVQGFQDLFQTQIFRERLLTYTEELLVIDVPYQNIRLTYSVVCFGFRKIRSNFSRCSHVIQRVVSPKQNEAFR